MCGGPWDEPHLPIPVRFAGTTQRNKKAKFVKVQGTCDIFNASGRRDKLFLIFPKFRDLSRIDKFHGSFPSMCPADRTILWRVTIFGRVICVWFSLMNTHNLLPHNQGTALYPRVDQSFRGSKGLSDGSSRERAPITPWKMTTDYIVKKCTAYRMGSIA